MAPWILGSVALLQSLAFFTFVEREISWTHCFNFDQASYLYRVYTDYELLLTKGVLAAVTSGLTAPVAGGALLSTEAALVFAIFGMSRKVALGLHLAHWLICQWLVFVAGRKIGKSASWGLAATGVLLALPAPMALVGGMFDFRFDGSAISLMGILAALVVLSDGFEDRKWTVWFGIAAGYSIWVRHLLLVYISGGLGLYVIALLVLIARVDTSSVRQTLIWRLRNSITAAGITGVAIVLLVVVKFDVLYQYYYVGHFQSAEKDVRAAAEGATGLTRYTYYLDSVIRDQMGFFSLGLLTLFFGWQLLSRLIAPPAPKPAWHLRGEVFSLAVLAAIMAATFGVLSYDVAKSPIVGNVFCVPVVLAALLLAKLFQRPVDKSVYRRYGQVAGVVALVVLGAGCLRTYQRYSLHSQLWGEKAAIEQIVRTHLQIGEYTFKMPAGRAVLFLDRNTDYQNAVSIMVSNYERAGRVVGFDDPVGGNVMLSDWAVAREHLLRSDIALVTEAARAGESNAAYPTTRMFSQHLQEINALANDQMTRTGGFQIGDHKVGVYIRPRVEIEGESAGWLTSAGIRLRLRSEWLKGKKGLVIEGRTLHPEPLRAKLGGRVIVKSTGRELPVYFSPITPDYRIEIDTGAVETNKPGELELEVSFDRYWIPRKEGISADDRQLVISAPRRVTLLTEPKLVWNERQSRVNTLRR